jgi:hypothetical protein
MFLGTATLDVRVGMFDEKLGAISVAGEQSSF